ncbi:MAG: hypothetical protein ACI4SM_04055 [Candidatus Gastranaerophilaceae bacterium]
MGMAASQARYLGLTARKTNTEYEGQQINQARTALANQSANLWNRMLALSVPTAPKTTDFTELQYSFSDGYNDYEIDKYENVDYTDDDGEKYNYQVTYHYTQEVFKAIQQRNTNPQVQKITTRNTTTATENDATVVKNTNGYNVTDTAGTSAQFKKCTAEDLENLKALESQGLITIDNIDDFYKTTENEGTANELNIYAKKEDLENIANSATQQGDLTGYGVSINGYTYKLGNSDAEKIDLTDKETKASYDQIIHDFPELANVPVDEIWTYQKDGKTCYAKESDLEACIASGSANQPQVNDQYQISSPIDYQSALNQYYTTHVNEKITEKKYARLDDASGTGRYSSIKLKDSSYTFNLKSEEKTDQTAYNDAMNQYTYDITAYEKELADINAKTSAIQVQDRTLELRLKQLDTEQKALSTEMDAVKSVIQKNVETTFKTFS